MTMDVCITNISFVIFEVNYAKYEQQMYLELEGSKCFAPSVERAFFAILFFIFLFFSVSSISEKQV